MCSLSRVWRFIVNNYDNLCSKNVVIYYIYFTISKNS